MVTDMSNVTITVEYEQQYVLSIGMFSFYHSEDQDQGYTCLYCKW